MATQSELKSSLSQGSSAELRLFQVAFWLGVITVAYNLVEGGLSTAFGLQDETLALFGFGVDSFIEVISAVGVVHMIMRIRVDPSSSRDEFERRALRITGFCFYFLTAGLVISASVGIVRGHEPQTTFWGVVISGTSIVSMSLLVWFKMRVGRALASDPIIADAKCTRACLMMSVILLFSSVVYFLTGIGYLDSMGALGIAYLAWKEGRESFEKAKGKTCCGCSG